MHQNNTKYLIFLVGAFIILFFISGCDDFALGFMKEEEKTPAKSEEKIDEEEVEVKEEIEEISFSQEDFVLKIDTLPYQGAVLLINYLGDVDVSDYELRVAIIYDEEITQTDIVKEVDNNLISPIIDLKYFPGDELEFLLMVEDKKYSYLKTLERYPFKDWMFGKGYYTLLLPHHDDNFVYGEPSWEDNVGAHASWDIWTDPYETVYSGTTGVVSRICPDSVEIFNPHVGVILQYGHIIPTEDLYEGKNVSSGDYIGNVCPIVKHVHYSTIRPYRIGWDRTRESYWFVFNVGQEQLYSLKYYRDPFYFHEPTTLGYWYEETLPEGSRDKMIEIFKKHNDVVLPAREPLN